jgi:osmoprotectant transport system permease protein
VQQPVLALLLLLLLASLLWLPLLTVAPNRLLTGQGLPWHTLLNGVAAALLIPLAVLAAAVFAAPQRRVCLCIALAAALLLTGLVALAGAEAARWSAQLSELARVSTGGGFWLALLLAWAVAADALQRLKLSRRLQAAARLLLWLPLLGLLATGTLDSLSLLKEYANRRDEFHAALGRHLQIVGAALAPALLLGLPLGMLVVRRPWLERPLFATLNLIQTVPSIALFGLLIGPLAWLGQAWPDLGLRGIGLVPAAIALALYALLPIVHGVHSGLRQVPNSAIEAATGMGMTPRQRLWQVELPLALPVLLSALRLAVVQLIGLAVVAALIGAGGLGAIIFQGLLSSALDLVLLGVLPVVAMALAFDAALRWMPAAERRQ